MRKTQACQPHQINSKKHDTRLDIRLGARKTIRYLRHAFFDTKECRKSPAKAEITFRQLECEIYWCRQMYSQIDIVRLISV